MQAQASLMPTDLLLSRLQRLKITHHENWSELGPVQRWQLSKDSSKKLTITLRHPHHQDSFHRNPHHNHPGLPFGLTSLFEPPRQKKYLTLLFFIFLHP